MSAAGHARRLLTALDQKLTVPVELTLYGRAALHPGFSDGPPEFGLSRNVDAILCTGQAEELAESTNFRQALDTVNRQFHGDALTAAHVREAILFARVPAVPEIEEQFALASARLLQAVRE